MFPFFLNGIARLSSFTHSSVTSLCQSVATNPTALSLSFISATYARYTLSTLLPQETTTNQHHTGTRRPIRCAAQPQIPTVVAPAVSEFTYSSWKLRLDALHLRVTSAT